MPPKQPKPNQETCSNCKKKSAKAVECDICLLRYCLKCSEVSEAQFELTEDIDHICKPCKEGLPRIRELMNIKEKLENMEEDITNMKTDIEENKNTIAQQGLTYAELNRRLMAVEKVIKDKKLDDEDFPSLPLLNQEKDKVSKILMKQKKFDDIARKQNTIAEKQDKLDIEVKKQKVEKEEEKRREGRENNLVVYGVPEEEEDTAKQMNLDYNVVKHLYNHRVNIEPEDLIQITRLGDKKPEQIRPIRITFSSMEKRTRVLRNNRDLKLYDGQAEECTYTNCNDEDKKHLHVYVSPDKTKQQRDQEKDLRDEMRTRRTSGETDLIIRNNKIVKKSVSTQVRWADVYKDGGY